MPLLFKFSIAINSSALLDDHCANDCGAMLTKASSPVFRLIIEYLILRQKLDRSGTQTLHKALTISHQTTYAHRRRLVAVELNDKTQITRAAKSCWCLLLVVRAL
jgi:hypothetical protein